MATKLIFGAFFVSMLLSINMNLSAGGKEDKNKIQTLIENVCKRKDIDKLKKSIKERATYYFQNKQDSFIKIIEEREKTIALGQGSYEEILWNEITLKDDIAYVLCKTKYTGKDEVTGIEISEVRLNTIILQKDDKWKILHWHISFD